MVPPGLWVKTPYNTFNSLLLFVFRSGGGSAGITAKDALGNDVKASEWLKSHPAGDRNLVQGLKVLALRAACTPVALLLS